MLECVINVSEGRDLDLVGRIAATGGRSVLDVHSDVHHNRSVLTVVGEEAARAIAGAAVDVLDLRAHDGVHPRIGVVDVVPFVALAGSTPNDAVAARDRFAAWFSDAHGVPCFLYGPERTLPEVRRRAFVELAPQVGPDRPHPTAGATAVGQRDVLVAFNVVLVGADLATARRIAAEVRGPGIRALGLAVGDAVQVSMNLVDPAVVGPAEAFDRVGALVTEVDAVEGLEAELVGLVPASVLDRTPRRRWHELDLSEDRTIEARLSAGR